MDTREPRSGGGVIDAHSGPPKKRELVVLIELVDGILSQAQATDSESVRISVWLSLNRIIREIQEHLEKERVSFAEDPSGTSEVAGPIGKLERKHSSILEQFSRASASVAVGGNFLPGTIVSLLREVIASFRELEEREVVLFEE